MCGICRIKQKPSSRLTLENHKYGSSKSKSQLTQWTRIFGVPETDIADEEVLLRDDRNVHIAMSSAYQPRTCRSSRWLMPRYCHLNLAIIERCISSIDFSSSIAPPSASDYVTYNTLSIQTRMRARSRAENFSFVYMNGEHITQEQENFTVLISRCTKQSRSTKLLAYIKDCILHAVYNKPATTRSCRSGRARSR